MQVTRDRRVGVIATKGTVASNAYSEAIRHIDAGITVFSTATPRFVEIAELGLKMAEGPIESYMAEASKVPHPLRVPRNRPRVLRAASSLRGRYAVLGCTITPFSRRSSAASWAETSC